MVVYDSPGPVSSDNKAVDPISSARRVRYCYESTCFVQQCQGSVISVKTSCDMLTIRESSILLSSHYTLNSFQSVPSPIWVFSLRVLIGSNLSDIGSIKKWIGC
jgi:hypothetical protein